MKVVKVAAAIIKLDEKILVTQRGYGPFKGGWEFPGGKIEKGESPREALVREIKEELDVLIDVGDLVDIVNYDYPDFHLTMYCYWCSLRSGSITLKEHQSAKWLKNNELMSVEWLPADVKLVENLMKLSSEL
ncbi:(deoxy)nucleoside triphosphate pyrophosphohydrolase [Anaerovorax odorimutans]|uniref:8-oxo-dGTP diphosphatase n=1 Tax=Anaerovorax odorimutans TaxID=109327 RepID=A0ABT1RLJ6_9FIRM|nr:(deoxy)nucleoside triphosphate pyrophosphohydrolase [Anaerovorax odorimutans]MCQ4636061.1 (deoxy)nucleoside triphosphate pyrophosphohydrolase [Anaerovorax odorimutans]